MSLLNSLTKIDGIIDKYMGVRAMLTIDALKNFGANTEEALGRCFNNEEFYLKLVKTVPAEPNFDQLVLLIENGDLKRAFEHAHALKGVLANLSLTPIYDPANEITERLRGEENIDYKPLLEKMITKRDELKTLCEE